MDNSGNARMEASFALPKIQHTVRKWLHRKVGIKKCVDALRGKVKAPVLTLERKGDSSPDRSP